MNYELELKAPFNLSATNEYFGGWLPYSPDSAAVAMAFPVEDWEASAAVVLRQPSESVVTGEVTLTDITSQLAADRAWTQALSVLSLDGPGGGAAGWQEVGQHDPVIGRLQGAYNYLRPVLFHSPYEAAAAFIIGHRISIAQGRAIRQRMAQELGDRVQVGGTSGEVTLFAFPSPQILAALPEFKGISAEKIERLHGVAEAAMDGKLDRADLRSLPIEEALERLMTLKGVGGFFAQGILMRGAGLEDSLTDDDVTKKAVQLLYSLPEQPTQTEVAQRAEAWRPYRMWATVLLHVWLRREMGGPHRR